MATAALIALPATSAAVAADDAPSDVSVSEAIAVIEQAAPDVLDGVVAGSDTTRTAGSLSVDIDAGSSSEVHLKAGAGIEAEGSVSDRPAVQIELPFAETSDDGVVVDDAVVAFDNNNGSLTVPVLKDDGAVQITTIIDSANAPSRYDYEVGTDEGATLQVEASGHVIILTADGEYAGGFAPAWAKDASGADVRTHYEVSGTTLTQVVEHTATDVQYPVTADPYLGIDLIETTRWFWETGPQSWRLSVTPTFWGKTASSLSRTYAWSEVKAKTYGTREDTPSMRDQLYCHIDGRPVVVATEGWGATYDLDLWRPYINYAALLAAKCNN